MIHIPVNFLLSLVNPLAKMYLLRGMEMPSHSRIDKAAFIDVRIRKPDTESGEREFKLLDKHLCIEYEEFAFPPELYDRIGAYVDDDGMLVLPERFRFNGANAPIGKQRYLLSSSGHDAKYSVIGSLPKKTKADKRLRRVLRKKADRAFAADVVLIDGQHATIALIGYIAVRCFGFLNV